MSSTKVLLLRIHSQLQKFVVVVTVIYIVVTIQFDYIKKFKKKKKKRQKRECDITHKVIEKM